MPVRVSRNMLSASSLAIVISEFRKLSAARHRAAGGRGAPATKIDGVANAFILVVFNGVSFRGCRQYANEATIRYWLKIATKHGVFAQIMKALYDKMRKSSLFSFGRMKLDSTSVKTLHGGDLVGYNFKSKSDGTKISLLVDENGSIISFVLGAAHRHDMNFAKQTLLAAGEENMKLFTSLEADKGYDSFDFRKWLKQNGIELEIRYRTKKARAAHEKRKRKSKRWIVERTNALLKQFECMRLRRVRHGDVWESLVSFVVSLSYLRAILKNGGGKISGDVLGFFFKVFITHANLSSMSQSNLALAVVNYCLQAERESFWSWAEGNRFIDAETGEAAHHVYALALRAGGLKQSRRDEPIVIESIVDDEAAAAVISHYETKFAGEEPDLHEPSGAGYFLRWLLRKVYYKTRYIKDAPSWIHLLYLRCKVIRWEKRSVRVGDLKIGHPVAHGTYLFARVEKLIAGRDIFAESVTPIKVVDYICVEGNGRVEAAKLAGMVDRFIEVEFGVLDGSELGQP